jgi:cystathionine gamma-synthase
MHFDTTAVHAGNQVDEETGALAIPIHLSTTFERSATGDTPRGFSYIRDANPTQTRLEEALAAIEGGERALAFGSGMAAATAVLQTLPAGSHVIFPNDSYYTVRAVAAEFFEKWNMTFDVAALEDLDAVRKLMRRETRLVWIESPSNPLLKIVDIRALCSIAREGGAMSLVDNTFASPALQRPIDLGAGIVLHSTTKYLGGHSDVMGGALTFAKKSELADRVEQTRHFLGGVASPFNSWLVLRGIRSLSARMRFHSENAMAVARFLAKHPRVEAVFYPGLESHPRHDVARRQMSAFGGMLSFLVRGGKDEALGVTAKVKIFTRATSLGGVESLIEHRASSEGPASTTAPNLLRASIGLEHADDLIADLRQALH